MTAQEAIFDAILEALDCSLLSADGVDALDSSQIASAVRDAVEQWREEDAARHDDGCRLPEAADYGTCWREVG